MTKKIPETFRVSETWQTFWLNTLHMLEIEVVFATFRRKHQHNMSFGVTCQIHRPYCSTMLPLQSKHEKRGNFNDENEMDDQKII